MIREDISVKLDQQIAAALRAISVGSYVFQSSVAAALGLHHSDLLALHAIGAAGGQLSAGDLSAQLELTSGATTALIDRLERLGYVARERDPTDRRKVLLRATGESAAKLRGRYRGIDDRIRVLLATRSAAEKTTIARFLAELVASAKHEKE